jgi:hypothetical protein
MGAILVCKTLIISEFIRAMWKKRDINEAWIHP